MGKIKEFFAHPIIQFALVLGASTIVLAYYSKRVLPEPLSNLELALPALLASIFEGLAHMRKKDKKLFGGSWIGILIIVVTTVLIIVLNR